MSNNLSLPTTSEGTSEPSSGTDVPCLVCHAPTHRRRNYKRCGRCGLTAHISCVGLTKQASATLRIWHCPPCINEANGISSTSLVPGPNQDAPVRETVPENLAKALAQLKASRRLVKRIPKSTRILVASTLSNRIEAALNDGTPLKWWSFLSFAYSCLLAPEKSTVKTANYIRQQIANDSPAVPDQSPQEPDVQARPTAPSDNLGRKISSKCADGDIKAALRLLTSEDIVIAPSEEVVQQLREKHSAAPQNEALPEHASVNPALAPTVDSELAYSSLKSMSAGSSAGLDGIRPLHLQQLTSQGTSEAGHRLITSITKLLNTIMSGQVPDFAREAIFGASLFALRKNDNGIRPIAIGSVYRRLAARILAHQAASRLSHELSPTQLGVGVPHGCEAAVHAVREFIAGFSTTTDTSHVLVKVDVKNAFNSLNRDALLLRVREKCPELEPIISHSYSSPTPLFYWNTVITSQRGVQQGDPLGPLAFALAVDPIIRLVNCPLNVWYLDDGCLAGPAEQVAQDLSRLRDGFSAIGLQLNPHKCEVAYLGPSESSSKQTAISIVSEAMPGIAVTSPEALSLLGSPLHDQGLKPAVERAAEMVSLLCDRLQELDAHLALFFLTHYISAPRLTYLLRSCPTFKESINLTQVDETVKMALSKAVNVDVTGEAWTQATLPTRMGGLGIRRISDLSRPCFLASLSASAPLIGRISPSLPAIEELDTWLLAREEFLQMTGVTSPPEGEAASNQRAWSDLAAESTKKTLLDQANQIHRARLLAACSAHSAAWSQVVPIASLGLHLDNETIRTAVALRLGTPVCRPHTCRCGSAIDSLGHHGLSCRFSQGRLPRHANLNDVIKRALAAAGVPSWLEPVGLDRGDGRRPDGITVFPFSGGRCLCWDATCVDTFSQSALLESSLNPGSAATAAESDKRRKYSVISETFRFEPMAVETSGVIGPSSLKFLTELGSRIRERTGERRETQWLFQRISLAVVRGNAAAVLASGSAFCDRQVLM